MSRSRCMGRGCQASSAIVSAWLIGRECDHDLAGLRAALLDMGHGGEGVIEGEDGVNDWTELPAVVERAKLAQLGTAGLHEEEFVAHAQLLRVLAHPAAE